MEGQHTAIDAALQSQLVVALPTPLLEQILFVSFSSTTTKDKKALRLTCKLFQQVLDDSLTCIKLRLYYRENLPCLESVLKRMQHVQGLNTVVIEAYHDVYILLRQLPGHITALAVDGININPKELTRLTCLTALHANFQNTEVPALNWSYGKTMSPVSHTCSPACSMVHLAPTLKHLSIGCYDHVHGMDQLTNLQVLKLCKFIPANFFQKHGHLPLKHLCLFAEDVHIFNSSASPPTSLQRLTICNTVERLPALPTSITHLQLMSASMQNMEQIGRQLPWLRSLDLHIPPAKTTDWNTALRRLSKITNLQCLGMCVRTGSDYELALSRDHVLSEFPEVAQAVERGVQLDVVNNHNQLLGVFKDPRYMTSAWAARG